jgi:hypothetical protein
MHRIRTALGNALIKLGRALLGAATPPAPNVGGGPGEER